MHLIRSFVESNCGSDSIDSFSNHIDTDSYLWFLLHSIQFSVPRDGIDARQPFAGSQEFLNGLENVQMAVVSKDHRFIGQQNGGQSEMVVQTLGSLGRHSEATNELHGNFVYARALIMTLQFAKSVEHLLPSSSSVGFHMALYLHRVGIFDSPVGEEILKGSLDVPAMLESFLTQTVRIPNSLTTRLKMLKLLPKERQSLVLLQLLQQGVASGNLDLDVLVGKVMPDGSVTPGLLQREFVGDLKDYSRSLCKAAEEAYKQGKYVPSMRLFHCAGAYDWCTRVMCKCLYEEKATQNEKMSCRSWADSECIDKEVTTLYTAYKLYALSKFGVTPALWMEVEDVMRVRELEALVNEKRYQEALDFCESENLMSIIMVNKMLTSRVVHAYAIALVRVLDSGKVNVSTLRLRIQELQKIVCSSTSVSFSRHTEELLAALLTV
eukprot:GHVL01030809.1.p1 GENE.GHVL01030809.1~~GHVL01030809.1.p1  ORF type:complete len:437 (-),score=46.56 GHVL01030809.1:2376-3686(-)